LNQLDDNIRAVKITPKAGKSSGAITVYYAGNKSLPTVKGEYAITFDVAAATGWNEAKGLNPNKKLNIGDSTLPSPVVEDYIFSENLEQAPGSVTPVTVTVKSGKSTGEVTVYYEGIDGTHYPRSTTVPQTAGAYDVTFDVASVPNNYNGASALFVGVLRIEEVARSYTTELGGISFTPLYLGLTPGNTTKELNITWYSTGTISGRVAQVKFVRGTFASGYELIPATGTVGSVSGSNYPHKVTVTGLKPGASYEYSVSSDGTNWSTAYTYKIPAENAPFKFAVIADPQLNTSYDTFNRYYPTGGSATTNTPLGWKESVQKIIAHGASFIASCGDQVDTASSETQYTDLFAPDGIKTLPFAPVMGNHDTNTIFFSHYNIPNEKGTANSTSAGANYYYLYNRILFVCLNTSATPGSQSDATPYINRFRTTIQAAKTAHAGEYDWLIVQHHKSTASVAVHLADRDIQYYVEAGFETLMSEENVDFVLAGHDHVYARSYPLQGMDNGKVSVPDKSANVGGKAPNTYTNPGKPIYLTFTTASGLKYYPVAADPQFKYGTSGSQGIYVSNNTVYPYLGETMDNGLTSTFKGSSDWLDGKLPVSNAAYAQPWIPSYCIVEVNGRTIKFSTYAIGSAIGTSPGATEAYSYDENIPYDWVTVTKN